MDMKLSPMGFEGGQQQPPSYYPGQLQTPFAPPATVSGPTMMTQPVTNPTNVVVVKGNPPVGPDATRVSCPHCSSKQMTRVEYKPTMKTHCLALVFCFTGLVCFAPVPYFVNTCKNANHYCSNCEQYLGSYNKSD